MNNYETLAGAIVKHQESIIGPLAWVEAQKVPGLKVSDQNISIAGEGTKVLESLVKQYQALFGQASVEVCKDAVKPLMSKLEGVEIPTILK